MVMRRRRGLGELLAWRLLLLVLFSHAVPAAAQVSIGATFPIATNWMAVGAAFDGTSYLVALESDRQTANVAAQLISQTGARVGSPIALGRNGQTCCNAVAFDGTNYLMVWEDDQGIKNSWEPFMAYGQFISASGAALGQPFAISSAGISIDGLRFLAYGSGKYLLTYTRLIVPANGDSSNNRYIAGRIVSPDGTIGDELHISSGFGARSSIGFDGTNFFVVWIEDSLDYEVRGRFVSPTGTLGQEISVNASAAPSDSPPVVAFDGTNYLVVFPDAVGATATNSMQAWDVLGQRVSPAGALVGGVITISNDPGTQLATGVAFDGTNYLVTWIDMQNSANWDVYGRYVGSDGALVGGRFAINTDAGNQLGGAGEGHDGRHLVLVSSGVQFDSNGPTQVGEVSGLFVSSDTPAPPGQPVAPPPATQAEYTVPTGQMPDAAVSTAVEGTLGSVTLTVSLDLSRVLSGGTFAAQGRFAAEYNIYVVALVPGARLGLANAAWFVLPETPAAWAALGVPIAAYMRGLAEGATHRVEINILQGFDVTGLVGTEIYIGYGTSDDEMLRAGRYRGVYKVQ